MVKEFTDLQGVVGRDLRAARGASRAGVEGHLRSVPPAGGPDARPREASGAILGLADRFDTLAGLFRLGLVPTGSKDPYGLRRAAAGIVAIVIARSGAWTGSPSRAGAAPVPGGPRRASRAEPRSRELEKFFAERLRNLLERRGHPPTTRSRPSWDGGSGTSPTPRSARRPSTEARRQDGLPLADPRLQADPEHRGGRPAGAPDAALYREDAERRSRPISCRRGSSSESSSPAAATAPRWRRSPPSRLRSTGSSSKCSSTSGAGPEAEPSGAARRDPEEFSRLADFSEIVVEK